MSKTFLKIIMEPADIIPLDSCPLPEYPHFQKLVDLANERAYQRFGTIEAFKPEPSGRWSVTSGMLIAITSLLHEKRGLDD